MLNQEEFAQQEPTEAVDTPLSKIHEPLNEWMDAAKRIDSSGETSKTEEPGNKQEKKTWRRSAKAVAGRAFIAGTLFMSPIVVDAAWTAATGLGKPLRGIGEEQMRELSVEEINQYNEQFSRIRYDTRHIEDSTQQQIENIEKIFRVDVVDPQEQSSLRDHEGKEFQPESWTPEKLAILKSVLSKLAPAHSYMPIAIHEEQKIPIDSSLIQHGIEQTREIGQDPKEYSYTFALRAGQSFTISYEEALEAMQNGYISTEKIVEQKVRFFLGGDGFSHLGSCICGRGQDNQDVVLSAGLEKKGLTKYYKDSFARVLIHELTHRVTSQNFPMFQERIFQVLDVQNEEEFQKALEQRLGKLDLFKNILRGIKNEKRPVYGGIEGGIVYYNLKYGSESVGEFLSVAGENFVYGKGKFFDVYPSSMSFRI